MESGHDKAVKPVKVAICVPCQDHVASFWAYDLARLTAFTTKQLDIVISLIMCTGSLVMKQRESLLKAVLDDPDATHVLWLDSDIRFPKDTLIRLLGHGVPWVCASYTERNAPFRPVAFADPKDFGKRVWPSPEATGLVPIAACGFGLMLMDLEWARLLTPPRFMVGYNPDTHAYMGEDIYFCLKASRETGTQLMLDQGLTNDVSHIGRFEFGAEHALKARKQREEQGVVEANA